MTISQAGMDIKVEVDEFDGKVVYGKKRIDKGRRNLSSDTYGHIDGRSGVLIDVTGTGYKGHANQLEEVLKELQTLEKDAQLIFLSSCQ